MTYLHECKVCPWLEASAESLAKILAGFRDRLDYGLLQMRPFLDQLWRCSTLAMNRQEAKIFVGGLNWSTSEEKLRSYFENFGSVQEAFVSYDRHTGRPRGFGFVVFEDPLVADKVVSIQHTIDRREVTF